MMKGLIFSVKKAIIKISIKKRNKKNPFNEVFAEHYKIPLDAGSDFNNSYYFSAHHLDGESLFVRLGERGGGSNSEIWFAYKGKLGFFSSTISLCKAEQSPLQVECLEPGKKWKISYRGIMESLENSENKKVCETTFEGIFTASAPIFDFTSDLNPEVLARSFANEKWNSAFFEEVNKNNQTHYEQQGFLKGKLTIGEHETMLDSPALRDHSFGKRDWTYMDKHIWLMALDKDGNSLNVSMVGYPVMRKLEVGNIYKNGQPQCILHTTGLDGKVTEKGIPEKVTVCCTLENGQKLEITAEKEAEVPYSFADEGYFLYEGIGTFTINGEKARGIMEFGFNSDQSRWNRN
jgi:hypothetical protein